MNCPKCGFNHNDIVRFCIQCGSPMEETGNNEVSSQGYYKEASEYGTNIYEDYYKQSPRKNYIENNPVRNSQSVNYSFLSSGNDPELLYQAKQGWNWGAFIFSWIWLCYHKLTNWGLILLLVSFFFGPVTLIASIYLGMKGNELAWSYRPFRDLEDFYETEKAWNNWGIFFLFLNIGLFVLGMIVAIIMPVIMH